MLEARVPHSVPVWCDDDRRVVAIEEKAVERGRRRGGEGCVSFDAHLVHDTRTAHEERDGVRLTRINPMTSAQASGMNENTSDELVT